MPDRSITSPPSQTEAPAMLWPPPRTATVRPQARATVTASATSGASAQRRMAAGRLSTRPFHTRRAAS